MCMLVVEKSGIERERGAVHPKTAAINTSLTGVCLKINGGNLGGGRTEGEMLPLMVLGGQEMLCMQASSGGGNTASDNCLQVGTSGAGLWAKGWCMDEHVIVSVRSAAAAHAGTDSSSRARTEYIVPVCACVCAVVQAQH
jgi:hypothetical protein